VRQAAVNLVPGIDPATVEIDIDRSAEPARARVRIVGFPVIRLQGAQPLATDPAAEFPYACD
jgi:hypothetical protein